MFIAHPECPPDVLALAESIQSTSGMIKYAGQSNHDEFILGTENGLLYPISKAYPDKKFYPASDKMLCKDMKKITLEKLADSLENLSGQVTVPEDIRIKALGSVEKMINL